MIISHKHKFIYFKTMKVAGTSTEVLLKNFCGNTDIVANAYSSKNWPGSSHYSPHITATGIKNKFGDKIFNSYFKFMTVRNPWDRVVSYFFHMKAKGKHCKRYQKYKIDEFSEFVAELVGPRPRPNTGKLASYYSWSEVDGKFILDDYIRYENLENDTLRILNKLNINYNNITYPHMNTYQRKSNKHYTEYYDDETRQIVAEKYAKDIEYFGYEFGE
jgi:hypothetical protein